jgi:hypothetical protein
MTPLLLAALASSPALASAFCPDPDLVASGLSVTKLADGSMTAKVTVFNQGATCSDSTTVELYTTKSGIWSWGCGSMNVTSVGIGAIPAGGSRIVSFPVTRGFWDSTADVSWYGYIDPGAFLDESDETDNGFVYGVKPKVGGVSHATMAWTVALSPACVLAELDAGFAAVDASSKLWMKAEML